MANAHGGVASSVDSLFVLVTLGETSGFGFLESTSPATLGPERLRAKMSMGIGSV